MRELHPDELAFEPSSVVDPIGRVFSYEGRIFRSIDPAFADSTREILATAEKQNWFEHGLVPTKIADLRVTNHPLILEHHRIPFVTLRAEWGAEALRAGALCCLRVAAAVARAGYCLKDAHTWNILFERTTAYFIDWGSIRPIGEMNWALWYSEFRRYFSNSLLFLENY